MKKKCNRSCPTPGYLPCSRLEGHFGPCAHDLSSRVLRGPEPQPLVKDQPPFWVSLFVWLLFSLFSLIVIAVFMTVFFKVLQ